MEITKWSEVVLSYAAGLFDGEGCVYVSGRPVGNGSLTVQIGLKYGASIVLPWLKEKLKELKKVE